MSENILIIEDEKELNELIRDYLLNEGYSVFCAYSAEEGIEHMEENNVSLILLDINLPGISGFEFLQKLRQTSKIPVIIISARETDDDIILTLGLGADKYVTKPFAPKVLVARVKALLRRENITAENSFSFGEYTMDKNSYVLQKGEKNIRLSSKEFEILRLLVDNVNQSVTTYDIYEQVWGSYLGDATAVAVYIKRLRYKLEKDPRNPKLIVTSYGNGYMFVKE